MECEDGNTDASMADPSEASESASDDDMTSEDPEIWVTVFHAVHI